MTTDGAKARAIVLRLIDYGEHNRIVTLYSPTLGRFGAMARGARGKSRRFGGHLDLFHVGEAQLASPRGRGARSGAGRSGKTGGLSTLTEFDAVELFEPMRLDLSRYATACFFVEMVLATTVDDDPAVAQYELLERGLREIATSARDTRPDLLLSFQLRWFDALGELPDLDDEAIESAHLPHLDPAALAIARALLGGIAIPELDRQRFAEIGGLTRALRHRICSREFASSALLAGFFADAWAE